MALNGRSALATKNRYFCLQSQKEGKGSKSPMKTVSPRSDTCNTDDSSNNEYSNFIDSNKKVKRAKSTSDVDVYSNHNSFGFDSTQSHNIHNHSNREHNVNSGKKSRSFEPDSHRSPYEFLPSPSGRHHQVNVTSPRNHSVPNLYGHMSSPAMGSNHIYSPVVSSNPSALSSSIPHNMAATGVISSDGSVYVASTNTYLRQVPGHPYLYYNESDPAFQQIKEFCERNP